MLTSDSSLTPSRYWGVILCLIVLAAVALRIYWAAGFMPKDDAEFIRVAYQMLQGTFAHDRWEGPPVIPVRTGIVLPTAASIALFGLGEAPIAIYPLIMSVVMIVLIYVFAAKMFGHEAAVIASIIWIFLPIEIELATMLFPEGPATAFAFIGIYCIYIARRQETLGQREQLMYGLVGGLAFGASWLCKESVVYFAPFCLALILYDFSRSGFKKLPTWAGIASGSLAVLIGEMLVYWIINGDAVYRFTAMYKNYELYPEFFFTEGSRFGFESGTPYWKAVVKRVAIDGPALIFLTAHFLFLPSFGAIAALYGLYRRDDRFHFMAGLMLVLILMFDAFSVSLRDYQPLPLFSRYFYAICVPAVVLTGGLLAILLRPTGFGRVLRERPESVFWGGIVIFVLVAQTAWSTFRQARDHKGTWSAAERYLAGVLTPRDRIHTDVLSRNALEFFWRYPDVMNVSVYGNPGRQITVRCDEYVLRNHSYNGWLATNYGSYLTMQGFELPQVVGKPPANWRIQWTNGNATLFRVVCSD